MKNYKKNWKILKRPVKLQKMENSEKNQKKLCKGVKNQKKLQKIREKYEKSGSE